MKNAIRLLTISFVTSASLLSHAQNFFGVTTDNYLVSFDASDPTQLNSKVAFTGFDQANELVLGIDFRPATGELYALGSSSRLYKVNTATGVVASVGPQFSTRLNGIEFGFDFNPTVDRIRVTSDNGQNLRLNPITGAVAATDINLAYGAGDINVGSRPNIAGSAYTNNFAGATTTTLFNIDSNLDTLAIQAPPNNGTLTTVGGLGYNVSSLVGFDILGANTAFASFTLENDFRSGLYSIDLTTGRANQLGAIGGTALQIRDLAVVPEPTSLLIVATSALALLRKRRS